MRAVVLAAVMLVSLLGTAAPATAATATVYVRGTVTCPTGEAFVGTWVQSSAGQAGWASWTRLPGTSSRQAVISRTLTNVQLPTTVRLNIGCGGSTSSWKYAYAPVGSVTATAGGTVFINAGCSTSTCNVAPRGTLGPTATTVTDTTQCTYRADLFWRQMTGRYKPWAADAGAWDDRAPAYGWQVRAWPEPDSLVVWQPYASGAGKYGHVAYVANVRVYNGATQLKIYDRNWSSPGADRNGVWISVPSGAKFIRVPPRFTPYNR